MKGGISPITRGGTDIWHVPYPNAGYGGGFSGQGTNLNTITIITQTGITQTRTPTIVTGFPSINGFPWVA